MREPFRRFDKSRLGLCLGDGFFWAAHLVECGVGVLERPGVGPSVERILERMMKRNSEQLGDGADDAASDRVGGRAMESVGGVMDPLDRDLLISRVVDGVASDSDWSAMDVIARTDAAIWRDLAQAQRCNTDLTNAVHAAICGTDGVELATSAGSSVGAWGRGREDRDEAPVSFNIQEHAQKRFNAMARWTGWAAAAALALAWVSGVRTGNPSGGLARPEGPAGAEASLLGTASASDLLAEYLRRGQASGNVVAEVPSKMMIEAVPMDDKVGGYEVYFVRQIVERTRVPNLYTFTESEGGQLQPVKARISAPRRQGSY